MLDVGPKKSTAPNATSRPTRRIGHWPSNHAQRTAPSAPTTLRPESFGPQHEQPENEQEGDNSDGDHHEPDETLAQETARLFRVVHTVQRP